VSGWLRTIISPRAGRPGFDFRQRHILVASPLDHLEVLSASYPVFCGSLSSGYSGRVLKLTHLCLVQRLSVPYVLMAWYGTSSRLPFFLYWSCTLLRRTAIKMATLLFRSNIAASTPGCCTGVSNTAIQVSPLYQLPLLSVGYLTPSPIRKKGGCEV
jgi:hypothetical protein